MIKKHAEKISAEELKDRAMQAGTSWHHHCMSPTCFVNDTGEEIIVLEAGSGTFYCPSSKELREELEEHAYKLNNTNKLKGETSKHECLDLVQAYSKAGDKWHFHIAMPSCFLSMATDYTIIIENDTTAKKHEWSFAQQPVELVRAIDDYYLGRKK
ncbi:MAG: hypothetical protein Q8P20_01860 [bacterium]|nr:hypothetical protein [bacterium]